LTVYRDLGGYVWLIKDADYRLSRHRKFTRALEDLADFNYRQSLLPVVERERFIRLVNDRQERLWELQKAAGLEGMYPPHWPMRWTSTGPVPIEEPHNEVGRDNWHLDYISEKTRQGFLKGAHLGPNKPPLGLKEYASSVQLKLKSGSTEWARRQQGGTPRDMLYADLAKHYRQLWPTLTPPKLQRELQRSGRLYRLNLNSWPSEPEKTVYRGQGRSGIVISDVQQILPRVILQSEQDYEEKYAKYRYRPKFWSGIKHVKPLENVTTPFRKITCGHLGPNIRMPDGQAPGAETYWNKGKGFVEHPIDAWLRNNKQPAEAIDKIVEQQSNYKAAILVSCPPIWKEAA
jgi:hypothetical protein